MAVASLTKKVHHHKKRAASTASHKKHHKKRSGSMSGHHHVKRDKKAVRGLRRQLKDAGSRKNPETERRSMDQQREYVMAILRKIFHNGGLSTLLRAVFHYMKHRYIKLAHPAKGFYKNSKRGKNVKNLGAFKKKKRAGSKGKKRAGSKGKKRAGSKGKKRAVKKTMGSYKHKRTGSKTHHHHHKKRTYRKRLAPMSSSILPNTSILPSLSTIAPSM